MKLYRKDDDKLYSMYFLFERTFITLFVSKTSKHCLLDIGRFRIDYFYGKITFERRKK